jgi:protein-glutamine gamma-glutamyltransferase
MSAPVGPVRKMIHPKKYFLFVLFVILPHFLVFPTFVQIFLTGLLCWSGFSIISKKLVPSSLFLNLSTLVAVGFCFTYYGTLIDPDAVAALLAAITILKLFEVNSYRHAMVLLFINLLLVMLYLINSVSIAATLYMFSCFFLFVYFVMDLQRKRYFLKNSKLFMKDLFSKEMVIALPLLVGLFVFFPRFTATFGAGVGTKNVNSVGFSDRIDLGQIISLVQSNEIAFKVRFLNQKPLEYTNLYFRGAVLGKNKNLSWEKTNEPAIFVNTPDDSRGSDYQVLLHPRSQKSLFTLDNAEVLKTIPKTLLFTKKNGNIFFFNEPPNESISYFVRNKEVLLDSSQENDTSLNLRDSSKQLVDLVDSLKSSNSRESIQNILRYFQSENFQYSTEAPAYKNIDAFIFGEKIGFCEHYASSTAILARLMGIPSRVIVGFLGGEFNPYDSSLTVRDKFAHAWIEVFYNDSGWTRVDPTAIIYPQRTMSPAIVAESDNVFYKSLFSNGFLYFESLNNDFELFMINFNSSSQWETVRWMISQISPQTLGLLVAFVLFFILLFLIFSLLWKNKTPSQDVLSQGYQLILKKLEKKGAKKKPFESPHEFLLRLSKEDVSISDQYIQAIRTYAHLRFGIKSSSAEHTQFYKSVKKLF